MTTPCPFCAAEVQTGVRFCPSCHSFLDWDTSDASTVAGSSTSASTATEGAWGRPGSGSAASGPGPGGPAGDAEQGRPALKGGGESLHVDAGSSVEASVLVGTTGSVVDEIRLTLEGPGAAFGTVTPDVVHLYPGATDSAFLRFSPPRSPSVPAGSHWWVLHAVSPIHGGAANSVAGVVEVGPFAGGSAELHPVQTTGRGRQFHHTVSVANEGNVAWSAMLRVEEAEHLHLSAPPAPVTVGPGERIDVAVPGHTRRRWLGAAQTMPFQIHVEPTSIAGPAPMEVLGTRTQRALLPVWLLPTILVLVGLAIAAFAVFGGVKVAVPTVQSRTAEDATEELERAGFQVNPVWAASDTTAQGLASGTEPDAGTPMDEGSTVTLFLSLGGKAPEIPIPAVVGRSASEARNKLEEAGLESSVTEEPSTAQEAGKVTRTIPEAGIKVGEGFQVVVYVSSGPPQLTIPPVSDLTEEQATEELRQLGLRVKVIQQSSDSVEAGNAIGTDPGQDESASAGATVTLYVSSGAPPTVEVPALAGESRDAAQTQLEQLGLTVRVEEQVSEEVPEGEVISTDPDPGTQLDPGDTVTLVTSAGVPEESAPVDLLGRAVDDDAVFTYVSDHGGSWDLQDAALANGVRLIGDPVTAIVATIALDQAYTGELPEGLAWGMNPEDVSALLGRPATLGEAPGSDGSIVLGEWRVDRSPVRRVTVVFDASAPGATEIGLHATDSPQPTPAPTR